MIRSLDFKIWEKFMVGSAGALFIASTGFYISGATLRHYFISPENPDLSRRVGVLAAKSKVVRLQHVRRAEFFSAEANEVLYDRDTLVTDAESSASILLDDGSAVELGPTTMVRLTFDSTLSFSGISHMTQIEVVAGSAKAEAKSERISMVSKHEKAQLDRGKPVEMAVAEKLPIVMPSEIVPSSLPSPVAPSPVVSASPSPSPSPAPPILQATAEELAPAEGSRFAVETGSRAAERAITLQWKMSSTVETQLLVVLRKEGAGVEDTIRHLVSANAGHGTWTTVITSPGKYVWELLLPDGKPLAKPARASFSVDPGFEAIETLRPLVAGQALSDNQVTGDPLEEFELHLSWKPYAGARDYEIKVGKKQFTVHTPSWSGFKGGVPTLPLEYEVLASLPSGFKVSSAKQSFDFKFLPPLLVSPKSGETVSLSQEGTDVRKNGLLLTWRRTHFTTNYQVEISADEAFKGSGVIRQKTPENFAVIRDLASGTYFWRVRAIAAGARSAYSDSNEITVTR